MNTANSSHNNNDFEKPLPLTGSSLAQIQFNHGNTNNSSLSPMQPQAVPPPVLSQTPAIPPVLTKTAPTPQPVLAHSQQQLQQPAIQPQQSQKQSTHPHNPTQPKEVEKKKTSFFEKVNRFFKNIKRTGCTIIFILTGFVALVLVTIIFKPTITWTPMKAFLNNGFEPEFVEDYTEQQTIDYINSVFSDTGQSSMILTEAQITALLRSKIGEGKEQIVDFEPGIMRIIADGDSNRGNPPLWLIIEMQEDSENKLQLNRMGFGRFGVPDSWSESIGNIVFRSMSLAQGKFDQQDAVGLLDFLVAKEANVPVVVQDVRFDKDQVFITYSVYNR